MTSTILIHGNTRKYVDMHTRKADTACDVAEHMKGVLQLSPSHFQTLSYQMQKYYTARTKGRPTTAKAEGLTLKDQALPSFTGAI